MYSLEKKQYACIKPQINWNTHFSSDKIENEWVKVYLLIEERLLERLDIEEYDDDLERDLDEPE